MTLVRLFEQKSWLFHTVGNTDPIPNSFTSKYNPLAFNVTYLHKYSHSFGNFTDFLIQFLLKDINSNHGNTMYNSSSLTYQYNIWSSIAVGQLQEKLVLYKEPKI